MRTVFKPKKEFRQMLSDGLFDSDLAIASERGLSFFQTNRIGWAKFKEPTYEYVFNIYQNLLKSCAKAKWQQDDGFFEVKSVCGCCGVCITYERGVYKIDFTLEHHYVIQESIAYEKGKGGSKKTGCKCNL
jgi:hypothetical protein